MEVFTGKRFSEIKNISIKDKSGEKIGRLIDAVLRPVEGGMELTKMVIGGSRWEELMENLGFREDIDPVFTVDNIADIKDGSITLDKDKDELKSTSLDEDALDDDETKLSDLRKYNILDVDGVKVGGVIDILFDKAKFQLVIGDGPVTEWAEDIGLIADVDFLLDPRTIKSIENRVVHLGEQKSELKSTFLDHISSNIDQKKIEENRDSSMLSTYMYFPRSY